MSAAEELPAAFGREHRGLPAGAMLWIAGGGAVFSLFPGITEIVSLGSLTFLLVFGLINLMHARHTATPGRDRLLADLGAGACFTAAGGLLFYLARSDRAGLVLIAASAAAIALARAIFVRQGIPRAGVGLLSFRRLRLPVPTHVNAVEVPERQ